MTATLGVSYGRESIHCEYKEFCIQVPIEYVYEQQDVYKIIKSGKIDTKFNSLIYQSIQMYFDNVIPKYVSSFFNSRISGNIFLGVNDFGQVTGIPLLNAVNIPLIQRLFLDAMSKHIPNFDSIQHNVTLQCIPLTLDTSLLTNTELNSMMHSYSQKVTTRNHAQSLYKVEKDQWFDKVSVYEKKINSLINSEPARSQLCEYVNTFCHNITVRTHVCQQLLSNSILTIENLDRTDPSTIFFWACAFKDHMLESLLSTRPTKPHIPIRIHPNLIFSRLTPMRLLFIQNNNNIQYYLIKISIKYAQNTPPVFYKYPFDDTCHFKIRRLNAYNQPFCSAA